MHSQETPERHAGGVDGHWVVWRDNGRGSFGAGDAALEDGDDGGAAWRRLYRLRSLGKLGVANLAGPMLGGSESTETGHGGLVVCAL